MRVLREMVDIYRGQLRLDVMVVNTLNSILKLDPSNSEVIDQLAGCFRYLSYSTIEGGRVCF